MTLKTCVNCGTKRNHDWCAHPDCWPKCDRCGSPLMYMRTGLGACPNDDCRCDSCGGRKPGGPMMNRQGKRRLVRVA